MDESYGKRFLKHQKYLNIHFVFHEILLYNFDHDLEKVLEYLEVNLYKKARSEIQEKVSFNNMNKDSPNHNKNEN